MATLAAASALARTRAVTGRLLNPPRALRSPLALRDVAGHSPRLSLSLTITLTSPNPTRTQHPNPGRGALRSARGSAHLRRRAGRGHGAEDRGGPARFLPEPAGDRAGRGHQGQARGLLRDLWPDSPLTPPPGRGAFRLYFSPLLLLFSPFLRKLPTSLFREFADRTACRECRKAAFSYFTTQLGTGVEAAGLESTSLSSGLARVARGSALARRGIGPAS